MKKSIFLILGLSILLLFACECNAETITLPNGQELNIDKLSDFEITQAIKTAQKSIEGKKSANSVMNMVKGVDPTELEVWAKLITGTIKPICNNLSITVNDFVKTPVGIGVAVLIAYRVMGADLLENALDIIIMVPLWFLMTGIILFLGWYFFSSKTVYEKISYNEKGKKIKEGGKRVLRYPWTKPVHHNDFNPMHLLAGFLIGMEIGGTILTLMIILG